MNKYLKIFVFAFLLILSNLYMLRSGFWFFQDAAYWAKNSYEALIIFLQQFHVINSNGYYLGFDQGLFNFTRIGTSFFTFILFNIFGFEFSQIAYFLIGYILTLSTFYLFSGLFFENKNSRYVLSLLYTFNPLAYSLQGSVFYNATVPLFIYSYYCYFYKERSIRLSYLILNIISGFILISYIRFLQAYLIIIIPYAIYLFIIHKNQFSIKKAALFSASYLLLFLPVIYSFLVQIMEKSQTAFNYGKILGIFIPKYPFFEAFNPFQSIGARIYEGSGWAIIGLMLFSFFLLLIITIPKKDKKYFYFLNLVLIILGLTIYGLGNIFGDNLYLRIIKIFPFVTNEHYWALHLIGLPSTVLLGILTLNRPKYLYFYSLLFVTIATAPLLNITDFQLQKFNLSKIPSPYYENFIKPYYGIPEATYYVPGVCWRAKYMDLENTPTLCTNFGLHYAPILFDNPRLISGLTYDLAKKIDPELDVDNLRITHNLKNILVALDIVKRKGPGPLTGDKEIQKVNHARIFFDSNTLLSVKSNENFNHYSFKNKNFYDFFIYSPASVAYMDISEIQNNLLDINKAPVVIKREVQAGRLMTQPNINISYKITPLNPTKYYIKISNINPSSPFIVQMNQAYAESWRIKFVDKKYFTQKLCIDKEQTFQITNNVRCQYKSNILELGDIKLLNNPEVDQKNHFIGNFLSNGWTIRPENIPEKYKNQTELYAVIIYTKQIYYSYTILISLFTLALLVCSACCQEINNLTKNNKQI